MTAAHSARRRRDRAQKLGCSGIVSLSKSQDGAAYGQPNETRRLPVPCAPHPTAQQLSLETCGRLPILCAHEGDHCVHVVGWIGQAIDQAVVESNERRPGGDAVLKRLSEMMFVDAARRYLDSLPEDSVGWLAGLRERYVGRALELLHGSPARVWSVDGLAQEVGLSRSALHDRFVRYLGQAPMQYLANWRIQLSSSLLRESHRVVADIALEVGNESEAAFARAFKRVVGMPPAAWRKSQGRPPQAPPIINRGP
jgi:AraC-like DNA-binding protein